MDQYDELVKAALVDGTYKPNRTAIDTISSFGQHYTIDLQNGFPLLTTKDMSGPLWDSIVYELCWYLSGVQHVQTLQKQTSIWDEWSDENGYLDTAYGRFWRRYPIPHPSQNENNQSDGFSNSQRLPGETWADETHPDVNIRSENDDGTFEHTISDYVDVVDDEYTFDQIKYAIEKLANSPGSRRAVVVSWHPANASVSTLPQCHYTFVLNIQGNDLNVHLTQRSGDIALGIPFNIAAYSILTHLFANEIRRIGGPNLQPGKFSHTIVDAHIYCGSGERGEWYGSNDIRKRIENDIVDDSVDLNKTASWIESNAPPEENENEDHVPNLLRQLTRDEYEKPSISIDEKTPINDISPSSIELSGYESHDRLKFYVAE